MLGFGKRKEEERKKQEALKEAATMMDGLLARFEQTQASGGKVGVAELTLAHTLVIQMPDSDRYRQRLQKIASAQGLRLLSLDEL